MTELEIRGAVEDDVPLILLLIRELAEYERLSHEVSATEETPRDSLFGERRVAETLLAYLGDDPAGFVLFFHSFSTFLGRPGIYLEDLYVKPEFRGAGRSEEHTSELQSRQYLVCRLLLEKKNQQQQTTSVANHRRYRDTQH